MNHNCKPHLNKEAGKRKRHGIITYPDKIGQYTFNDTIGEGSYSLVKLVYDEINDQYYACKIVPIRMLQKGNLYQRFELEIRISQIMSHPGVASIIDVLKDEYNFYIFMEYYPNGNLNNYILHKTKLSEEEAKGLIYQLFDALEYINSQGVAHRDLKPENIIIDNNGHIRISDFGLSQFVGEDNLVKTACGSPCYVSPEILRGIKYDGFISDVWSCGVILYIMVTGLLPWTKKNVKDIFLQIRIGDYLIPDCVSEQCKNLILMLLRVDPKKRITIEEAKHHTWFNIKSEDDVKNLLNYSIPIQYLYHPSDFLDEKDLRAKPKKVPYLSTKKVDTYFRPDVDCDFNSKFNDVSNVHAITNSTRNDKCEVSSPEFKFDHVMRLLADPNNREIKFRRRLSDQYDSQKIDFGIFKKIHSASTENLHISPNTLSKYTSNVNILKGKSENLLKLKPIKCQISQSKKNPINHRRSTRLPKQFAHTLKQ